MDWNNDGLQDLLVGDTEGKVQVFFNENSRTQPLLAKAFFIKSGSEDLVAGERATPVADDWNGDGKKDLITGNMAGEIWIFLNRGTDSSPVFLSHSVLRVGNRNFDVGSRSAPRVYDWNGDGLKDLLVGEMHGYVYFLKNTGSSGRPAFDRAERLFLRTGDFLRFPGPYVSPRSRLFVTDWNNDGRQDILVGGSDGRVAAFLASPEESLPFLLTVRKAWKIAEERLYDLKLRVARKLGWNQ